MADELAAKHPNIHVLHRAAKSGLGRAYCAGFMWALERDYEFILGWTVIFLITRTTSQFSALRQRMLISYWARGIATGFGSSTGHCKDSC